MKDRKNVKPEEVTKLTGLLQKRLEELIGLGDEEQVQIPPPPTDWEKNYVDDPENEGATINGLELAKSWGMGGDLPRAWTTLQKKLAAKKK